MLGTHTHDKTAYVNYRTFSGIASESLAIHVLHVPEKLENLSKSARYSYLWGGQEDEDGDEEEKEEEVDEADRQGAGAVKNF